MQNDLSQRCSNPNPSFVCLDIFLCHHVLLPPAAAAAASATAAAAAEIVNNILQELSD